MRESELTSIVREALAEVAPETAGEDVIAHVNLRDQMDFDSMDHLNFMIALHNKLGVDIPEADYPQLASIDGCLSYLVRKL